jgi:hypothetical protein
MKKDATNLNHPVIIIGLFILVIAGGCVTDIPASSSTGIPAGTPTLPPGHPPLSTVTATEYTPEPSAVPPPGSKQDPGIQCTPIITDSRIAVPANISVAIRDPMPGIRYSLKESESGRTIELEKGEIVEINLRWIPGLANNWIVPVSGCGLELVNAGTYSDGGDFWNNTGHYRVRYRAKSPGRSFIDGTFGVAPGGTAHAWNPRFNLTVIVK